MDCSGDADIAAFAGAPFEKGDENGKMLGVTLLFRIRDADLPPGERGITSWRMDGIDGTDPWDLTRCENQFRRKVGEQLVEARANRPEYRNAYWALTAPQLGVRDTRRIVGDHILTKEEWDAEIEFPDHIGYAYERKSVPYRSLMPQGVENLLVAGRCVSTDHPIQDPMRIIPPCMVTGHAAGAAAALAADQGKTPRALDLGNLQARLKKLGVPFPASVEANLT